MRVMVTGSNGFIGTRLCDRLLEAGYDVVGFERYKPTYGLSRPIPTYFGDITYFHSIEQALERSQAEAIIHLAAYSTADPLSYEVFDEAFDVNARGTVNVAEAARKVLGGRLQVFIQASSSEVYGNHRRFPLREGYSLHPVGPYHASKIACEYYLRYLNEVHGFPAVILRPFNTYGEHMMRRTVIERCIQQMLEGPVCRLGDPEPVRDFLYVDDHVNAYMACLQQPERATGRVFNACTERGVSIRSLAGMIAERTGFKGRVEWGSLPPRPSDIRVLVGSYGSAKRLLGWEPKVELEEGLQILVDRFREGSL